MAILFFEKTVMPSIHICLLLFVAATFIFSSTCVLRNMLFKLFDGIRFHFHFCLTGVPRSPYVANCPGDH